MTIASVLRYGLLVFWFMWASMGSATEGVSWYPVQGVYDTKGACELSAAQRRDLTAVRCLPEGQKPEGRIIDLQKGTKQ